MSALRSSAVIACVCCIACSIISVIAPSGRMKKTINLVLGLFLLCSMVVPFVGLFTSASADFSIEDYGIELDTEDSAEYESLVLSETANNLVKAANELLLSEGITAENIKVTIKKTEDDSIYISSIYIYINNDDKSKVEEIKRIIESNMTKEPVIIISEE